MFLNYLKTIMINKHACKFYVVDQKIINVPFSLGQIKVNCDFIIAILLFFFTSNLVCT